MFTTIALKSWISVQAALLLAFTTPFHDLVDGLRQLRLPRDHGRDHQLHVPLSRACCRTRRRGWRGPAPPGRPIRTEAAGDRSSGGRGSRDRWSARCSCAPTSAASGSTRRCRPAASRASFATCTAGRCAPLRVRGARASSPRRASCSIVARPLLAASLMDDRAMSRAEHVHDRDAHAHGARSRHDHGMPDPMRAGDGRHCRRDRDRAPPLSLSGRLRGTARRRSRRSRPARRSRSSGRTAPARARCSCTSTGSTSRATASSGSAGPSSIDRRSGGSGPRSGSSSRIRTTSCSARPSSRTSPSARCTWASTEAEIHDRVERALAAVGHDRLRAPDAAPDEPRPAQARRPRDGPLDGSGRSRVRRAIGRPRSARPARADRRARRLPQTMLVSTHDMRLVAEVSRGPS